MKLVKDPKEFSVGDLLVDEDGVYKIKYIYSNNNLELNYFFNFGTFLIDDDDGFIDYYEYHPKYDTVYTDCDLAELLIYLKRENKRCIAS